MNLPILLTSRPISFKRYAQKVWIALEASNSPFELQEISLYGNNGKPDWFLELNPAGTVPVLVTNGGAVTLCDSDVILDQMQRSSFGSVSLFPSEGQDVIQRWRTTVNSKLIPIGKKAVLSGRGISNDLKEALAELDSMVVGPYLAGESISTADCHAFPFLWRLNDEYRLDSFPKLKGWINKCSKEPPFKKTIQTSWWWWW